MHRPTLSTPLTRPVRVFWNSARITALLVTGLVLAGLVLRPELTLKIAWFGIVPILPASFLVNAGLWRSVCPIATANVLTGSSVGKSSLGGKWLGISTAIGITLLVVLVPARRLILNQDGVALAGLLVVIVLAAVLLGLRFNMKGGFCNSICPILPVEKLYGQSPLLYVRNPRCVPCSVCTQKGCYDLDTASIRSAVANGEKDRQRLLSVQGIFILAFPGFIFGYFQTSDTSLANWASVYAETLAPAVVSLIVFGGLVAIARIPGRIFVPSLGALAAGIYYWFAGPASADAFGWSTETGLGLRWMFLAFVAVWLVHALRRSGQQRRAGGRARPRSVEPAVLQNIH